MTYMRAKMVTTHVEVETTEWLIAADERSFLVTHVVATTYPSPSKRRAQLHVSGPVLLPRGVVGDEILSRTIGGATGYDVPGWLKRALAAVKVDVR